MKKQIRLLIIIPLLICYTNQTYSQNNRQKTILYDYNNSGYNNLLGSVFYSYCANGYVSKKKFVENQNLTLLMQLNTQDGSGRFVKDTIISGKYYTKNDIAYIDGIWKKWDKDFKKLIKVKGVFKISNIENGIGITTKKKDGKEPTIHLLSNNPYHISFYHGGFLLESNITTIEEEKLYSDIHDLNKYILNDKKVKFSFNNGDIFIGSVKRTKSRFYYSIEPYIGNYEFKTGESIKGEISYFSSYTSDIEFLPNEKSSTSFSDKTIEEGDWVNKYVFSLDYDQEKELLRECKSLTELRDKSKILYDKKNKKIEDKKKEKEREKIEKLQKELKRKKELTSKYGEHFGNLLSQGKLLPGMSEDMVKEVWSKEWFIINNIVRNGKMIDIWEFDESKMQRDIINKGKESGQEEGALGLLLMLNLSEELGLEGINAPKTLVFMDKKLTDIYR